MAGTLSAREEVSKNLEEPVALDLTMFHLSVADNTVQSLISEGLWSLCNHSKFYFTTRVDKK